MAWPAHVKAQALTMLLLGESQADVARTLSVPKQTVSRWERKDAKRLLREIVQASPELQAFLGWRPVARNGTQK